MKRIIPFLLLPLLAAPPARQYGKFGQSSRIDGIGVGGWASHFSGLTVGVEGNTNSHNGTGVVGYHDDDASEIGYLGGRYASVYGATDENKVAAIWGLNAHPKGIAVLGRAISASGTGPNYGGQFVAANDSAVGVYGEASSTAEANWVCGGQFVARQAMGYAICALALGACDTAIHADGHFANWDGGNVYTDTCFCTHCTGTIPCPLELTCADTTIEGHSTMAGTGVGVFGEASGATGIGLVGLATASGAATPNIGAYGEAAQDSAWGVYGIATTTDQLNFSAGVYGEATSQRNCAGVYGTAPKYGVYGDATGSSTQSVHGGHFLSTNASNTGDRVGVYAAADGNPGAGVTGSVGVYGVSLGTSGTCIGVSGNTGSAAGYGVRGTWNNDSPEYGVLGHPDAGVYGTTRLNTKTAAVWGYNNTSGSGEIGVLGDVTDNSTTNYGVYGRTASLTSGFGVYSEGPMTSTEQCKIHLHPMVLGSGNIVLNSTNWHWTNTAVTVHAVGFSQLPTQEHGATAHIDSVVIHYSTTANGDSAAIELKGARDNCTTQFISAANIGGGTSGCQSTLLGSNFDLGDRHCFLTIDPSDNCDAGDIDIWSLEFFYTYD